MTATFSYNCPEADKISTDIASGPSAIFEVVVCHICGVVRSLYMYMYMWL